MNGPSVARHGAAVRRPSVTSLRVALVAAVAALAAGCGEDPTAVVLDPCDPGYPSEPGMDPVIGPAGGAIEVTDPADPLFGLRVTVPAGAWQECWHVQLAYRGIFSSAAYPEGYVPFERPAATGSLNILLYRWSPEAGDVYPSDSMYVEIAFPVHRLERNEHEMFSAFFYDEAGESWRVKLPDAIDDRMLTVRTRAWRVHWSWGRIDLDEIDFEAHVEPALEAEVGTEAWHAISLSVDSLYRVAMRDRWEPMTCAALIFAGGVFDGYRRTSGDQVRAIQATFGCGDCDATTAAFYQELVDYIQLNVLYMLTEMVVDMIPGRMWPIKLAGYGLMGALYMQMYALPCDYPCLAEEATLPYYVYTAGYWASHLVVESIEYFLASDYLDCPVVQWAPEPPTVWTAGWAPRHPGIWSAPFAVHRTGGAVGVAACAG